MTNETSYCLSDGIFLELICDQTNNRNKVGAIYAQQLKLDWVITRETCLDKQHAKTLRQ